MSSALLTLILFSITAATAHAPASAPTAPHGSAAGSARVFVQDAGRNEKPAAPKPLQRTNSKPRAYIEENDERLLRTSEAAGAGSSAFDPHFALLHRAPVASVPAPRSAATPLVYVFCALLI